MQKLLALLMTTLNTELPLKISKVTPEGGQEKPGALTTEDRPVADLSATAVKTRTVFQEAVARRTIKKWYGVGYRKNSFLLDMAMALSPIGRSLTYLETLAATSGKLGAANGYFAQTPAKIREMVWEKITVLAEKSITEERARKAATAGSDDTASGSNGTGTGDNDNSGGSEGASSGNPQVAALAAMGIFGPLPTAAGSPPSEGTPRQEAEKAVKTWKIAVVSSRVVRLLVLAEVLSLEDCCGQPNRRVPGWLCMFFLHGFMQRKVASFRRRREEVMCAFFGRSTATRSARN